MHLFGEALIVGGFLALAGFQLRMARKGRRRQAERAREDEAYDHRVGRDLP